MKIQKGDIVRIIAGKYKWNVTVDEKTGEETKTPFEGKVVKVLPKTESVIVEGANIVKRHVKKQGTVPGQIFEFEKPIPVSNVMLVCPDTKKPTRIGITRENGKKVRISKQSGKPIKN